MQIGEKKNDNYTQPKILVLIMQAYRGLHLPAHKNTEMSDRFKRRKKKKSPSNETVFVCICLHT